MRPLPFVAVELLDMLYMQAALQDVSFIGSTVKIVLTVVYTDGNSAFTARTYDTLQKNARAW